MEREPTVKERIELFIQRLKEYDIEESESEEDIDKAIDELRHEINELKEIQQI